MKYRLRFNFGMDFNKPLLYFEKCKDERFQNQGILVRLYRRLRYQPLYFVYRWAATIWWLLRGAKPHVWLDAEGPVQHIKVDTRWETFNSIRLLWQSRCALRMEHYWSTNEVLANLRDK